MCLSPKEDASNYINLVPSSTKPNEVNVDDTSDNLSTGDDMDNYEAGSVIYNIVYKACTVGGFRKNNVFFHKFSKFCNLFLPIALNCFGCM